MTGAIENAPLRAMLAGHESAATPIITLHRALRLSLSSLADELFELNLELRGIEDDRIDQAEAIATDLEKAVYFQVDGPNDAQGLLVVSASIVSALIEIQTIGKISENAPAEREPTRTDAAMVERYFDLVLMSLGEMLAEVEGEEWTQGQRLGRAIFDRHQVPLSLAELPFRRLRIDLGFGAGSHNGEMVLILPARRVMPHGAEIGPQAAKAARAWVDQLTKNVLDSPCQLGAILYRKSLPLTKVRGFSPGDIFMVPDRMLGQIRIEGSDGSLVAKGRLGQADANRAVRLEFVTGAPSEPTESTEDAAVEALALSNSAGAEINLDALGFADLPEDIQTPLPTNTPEIPEHPELATAALPHPDTPENNDAADESADNGPASEIDAIQVDDLPELNLDEISFEVEE